MKIRRFFGKDMREALSQVKAELGADAVIMSNRKVADGIELVAAYDKETDAAVSLKQSQQKAKAVPSLSEIIGDDGPDSLKALLEKQNQKAPRETSPESTIRTDKKAAPDNYHFDRTLQESDRTGFSANERPRDHNVDALSEIQAELASLRNVLQFQVADLMEERRQRYNPVHAYMLSKLIDMGVSRSLSQQLVHYVPTDYNERDAWMYLLNLLANRVHVTGNDILQQTGVVALVGPTGTGKTTTLAKLAARYSQKYGAESVAMITIDTYRIAAYEQLATYGKIIGCVVKKAQSSEELADILFRLRHKRLVLIDTAGFSQRDSRLIKQLVQFDTGQTQPVRKYLVAQANTQYPALEKIVAAYKSVKLDGCIFTKLDECYSLGEILSASIEHQLPVSYVTDGQRVPEDIKVADGKSLVSAAAKLYKKYGLNHTNGNRAVNSAKAV